MPLRLGSEVQEVLRGSDGALSPQPGLVQAASTKPSEQVQTSRFYCFGCRFCFEIVSLTSSAVIWISTRSPFRSNTFGGGNQKGLQHRMLLWLEGCSSPNAADMVMFHKRPQELEASRCKNRCTGERRSPEAVHERARLKDLKAEKNAGAHTLGGNALPLQQPTPSLVLTHSRHQLPSKSA